MMGVRVCTLLLWWPAYDFTGVDGDQAEMASDDRDDDDREELVADFVEK